MEQIEVLSLATIKGGAIVERFDDELRKLVANIADPGTPATAKREVSLKFSVKPGKDRGMSQVMVSVTSKLAPGESMETNMFIAITRNGPVATEYNPHQPALPNMQADASATITPLRAVGGVN